MFDISRFYEVLDQQVKQGKMSDHTRDDYAAALKTLQGEIGGNTARLPPEEIEKLIHQVCRGNTQYGKYLSAVRKYERLVLGREKSIMYGEPLARLSQLRTESGGLEPKLPESTYLKKINRLNNEQLKVAFRLELKSGLRIAELADLTKSDIRLNEDGSIHLRVRSGKGRKDRMVRVVRDAYLYDKLKAHLAQLAGEDAPVFSYSKSYLKKMAHEHGIPTHDLRRVNARIRFRQEVDKGKGRHAARRAVAKELGHMRVKTTNLYLGREWRRKGESVET